MPAYPQLFCPLDLPGIGGAKEAGELDAMRAMLEGAELAARL